MLIIVVNDWTTTIDVIAKSTIKKAKKSSFRVTVQDTHKSKSARAHLKIEIMNVVNGHLTK